MDFKVEKNMGPNTRQGTTYHNLARINLKETKGFELTILVMKSHDK
jgi:hypothetical protein